LKQSIFVLKSSIVSNLKGSKILYSSDAVVEERINA